MGDVTGPISSLPYSRHATPDGTMCDEHPDRPAIVRIQGETDSFGSEMHDCCQECADAIKAERNSPEARTGKCDWCKQEATDLRPKRDYEEGMSGRVYDVCGACVRKEDEECRAELDAYDDDWDDDDPFDDDDNVSVRNVDDEFGRILGDALKKR